MAPGDGRRSSEGARAAAHDARVDAAAAEASGFPTLPRPSSAVALNPRWRHAAATGARLRAERDRKEDAWRTRVVPTLHARAEYW